MQEIGSNAKVAYERLSTASNEEKNDFIKKIATETLRTTQGIIVQLMQMNAKIVLAIFVTITVFNLRQ